MQEIVNKLLDTMGTILPDLEMSIKLGILGGLVIVVLFLIAFGISAGSKIDKYRRQLLKSTIALNAVPHIDENNIEVLHSELEKHPEEIQRGWSRFMDQRIGYPSDYMPASEVLTKRDYNGKVTAGKVFLIILGAIVCAFIASIGFMSDIEADTVMSAVIALEFMIIPVAIYIISILLIDIVYNRKGRRLELAYLSFTEIIDSKVVVSDIEEREFVSENLEEINKRVEELLADKAEDEEVSEVITAPKVEEVEELEEEEPVEVVEEEPIVEEEPEVEEEPTEEIIEETVSEEESTEDDEVAAVEESAPAIDYSAMTEEERDRYLSVLLDVVDRAVADENCDEDALCEIAAIIYEARVSDAYPEEDEEILDECLFKLAERVDL